MCLICCVAWMVISSVVGATGADRYVEPANATAVQSAQRAEGCVAIPSAPCSYNTTRPGRYLATGTGWVIEVFHPVTGRTVRYTDRGSSPNYRDAFGPGDFVTATAGTGTVWVGARP